MIKANPAGNGRWRLKLQDEKRLKAGIGYHRSAPKPRNLFLAYILTYFHRGTLRTAGVADHPLQLFQGPSQSDARSMVGPRRR
jgi:hypothetical protein